MPKGTSKKTWAFGKEWPSVAALCREYRVLQSTIEKRVLRGMDIEAAITELTMGDSNQHIIIDGKLYRSPVHACHEFKLPVEVYRRRRENRWGIIVAVTEPESVGFQPDDEPIIYKGKRYSKVNAALRDSRVAFSVYNARREQGWSRARAIALPEVFIKFREPRMFPDELRVVLTSFDDQARPDGPGRDDCHIWPGKLAKSGLIEVYACRKRYSVPRLVYCRMHDVHPSDLSPRVSIKPSCDNPRCINPEHMIASLGKKGNRGAAKDAAQRKAAREDSVASTLPDEVLKQARAMMTFADLGSVAQALNIETNILRKALNGAAE